MPIRAHTQTPAHSETQCSGLVQLHQCRNNTRVRPALLQSPNHRLGNICTWDESAQIEFFSPPEDLTLNASLCSFKKTWKYKLQLLHKKARACLETQQSPHASSSTRCWRDIVTLELILAWVISKIAEADRLLKITAHGLHTKGALKYFLITLLPLHRTLLIKSYFQNSLYCSSAILHRRCTNWVGCLPAQTVRWPSCSEA